MFRKVIDGLAKAIGVKILTRKVRAAAEGKLGPKAKSIYWKLAGWKTRTGLALACITAALVALGYTDVAIFIGGIAGIAIQVGWLDKAWRYNVPMRVKASKWYKLLVQSSADIAAILGALFAIVARDPDFPNKEIWQGAIIVVGAIFVQLGILERGWDSNPPEKS